MRRFHDRERERERDFLDDFRFSLSLSGLPDGERRRSLDFERDDDRFFRSRPRLPERSRERRRLGGERRGERSRPNRRPPRNEPRPR